MRKIDWNLCLIADAQAAGGKDLLFIIREASEAGASLIQLRGKILTTREFVAIASKAAEFLKPLGIPLVINDRVDIALACAADGVHIGQEDLPLPVVRRLLGNERYIGVSVNTISEAMAAEEEGADYLGAGPVFFTRSKEELRPIIGLDGLRAIRQNVKLPILAVGGINAENARSVIDSGADGIAVISAVLAATDIREATQALRDAMGSR
jgi:thiamine-phosphate pyrophosphorylase